MRPLVEVLNLVEHFVVLMRIAMEIVMEWPWFGSSYVAVCHTCYHEHVSSD